MKRMELMKQILKLLDQQWVTENDFGKVLDAMEVAELEAQIFAMTKIVDMVRMVPEEIFSNIESKQNMQQAAQEYLDSLVEFENEEDVGEAVVESDQGYGILGDISIPGVIDHGSVENRTVENKTSQSNSMIPNLGAPAQNRNSKE